MTTMLAAGAGAAPWSQPTLCGGKPKPQNRQFRGMPAPPRALFKTKMPAWRSAAAVLVPTLALACAPGAYAVGISTGPPQPTPYEVFTIGDSYASGEGAPDSDGVFDDNGSVQNSQFEDWDTRFGGSPANPGLNQDSTRCHRSGHTSTSAVAVAALQNAFPDLDVDWQSVACSGAAIVASGHLDGSTPANKGGILRGYDGVDNLSKRGIGSDKLSPAVYPSQIGQLNTIIAGRPAGPRRAIDALVMDLGGNDVGFGDIIADCTNIFPFKSDCDTDTAVAAFVTGGLNKLSPTSGNGLYDRLNASLHDSPLSGTGDPALHTTPQATFLTAAPNPLLPATGSFCDRTPKGGPEENVTAAESAWVTSHVADQLNAAMQRESTQHDWTFVDDYLGDFVGHAICTASPNNFVNTNLQALRREGRLDGLPPFVNVSAGIVHPNVAGYQDMGSTLFAAMAPAVISRFTPQVAPDTTITSSAGGFGVTFDDSQPARPAQRLLAQGARAQDQQRRHGVEPDRRRRQSRVPLQHDGPPLRSHRPLHGDRALVRSGVTRRLGRVQPADA